MTEPLAILFEDAHCLAVVKPAGVLTQGPASGAPSLESAVRHHVASGAPEAAYLGTVHRLDRPVSGVVLWAKTPKAARRLASQFARRAVRKEYWAIVEDPPRQESNRSLGQAPNQTGASVWEDWLAPVDADGVVRAVAAGAVGARRAVTRVSRGAACRLPEGTCWLRLWPETGRTHQLRAQAACRGRPVLGDRAYGSTRPFPCGIALHARVLSVVHPVRGTPLSWVAPVPESWGESGIALPEQSP